MKRFLFFAYYDYYPEGGMSDLKFTFNSVKELEEKKEELPNTYHDKYDILDLKTGRYSEENYWNDDAEDVLYNLVGNPEMFNQFK